MKFDRRLLALARTQRVLLILAVLAGFAGGILAVGQARLVSRAVAGVFLGGQGLEALAGILVGLLAVMLGRAALAWAGEVAAAEVAARIKTGLRRRLYAHLLALGPGYTGANRTGELANTAVEGVEALDAYFSQYLPQVAMAAVVPLTFLILVFPLDPLSAIVLLVTAPLIPAFMILIGSLADALTRRQWSTLSRLSGHFLDRIQGLETLKLLGRSRSQAQVIAKVGDRYRQATMGVLRITFLSALALELIATLSTAVVAVEIALRLLYGRLPFEEAFFVLILAPEFYQPLRSLGARFHAGMTGVAAAARIFEILDTPLSPGQESLAARRSSQSISQSHASALSPLVSAAPSITFENVSFAYPGSRAALEQVSLELAAGQRTALVGQSGAGKSTIAALLLRFGEPSGGRILADGVPLASISPAEWRAQVAWVPQAPFLFNASVGENIRLARPGAAPAEVEAAARLANAHGFIERLPQGYNTLIGERGARLSGGQAQRLALARAFLKDAPLLILDEATANLDPELEEQVQEALARLASGRTLLVIAHRLNTVAGADQIIVLKDGRVAETGSHNQLLDNGGLYRELVLCGDAVLTPQPSLSITGKGVGSEDHRAPASLSPKHAEEEVERPFSPHQTLGAGLNKGVLRRLLALLKPYWLQVALSVLLAFAAIASSIGLMSVAAYLIARAALRPSIAELQVAIVGVRFFGLARGVFRYLERLVSHQVTFRLLARLRTWFFIALEPLAPARLLAYRGGDLLSRALGDVAALENFYVRAVVPPLAAVLVAILMFVYLAFFSPLLAFVLVGLLITAGLGLPAAALYFSREPGRRVVSARAALSAVLVDGVQGLPDLLAAGAETRQFEQINAAGHALAREQRKIARLGALTGALSGLLANLGLFAVLALAIPLVRSGRLDGVSLAVLALAALSSFEAVLPLPAAAQHLESSRESARRLFELVDAQPEVQDPPEGTARCSPPGGREDAPGRRSRGPCGRQNAHPNAHKGPGDTTLDLEVRRLSFRYPPQPPLSQSPTAPHPFSPTPLYPIPLSPLPYALHDLTFSLPSGRRLAIVGPSGGGKTTLVSLLLRFWEYREGEILLGGRDLRDWRQEDVRRRLAVVSQRAHLFNASVRENLLLADPRASEADLVWTAQAAQIHDRILSLPERYDTWIGEGGLRLSGGEGRRLVIARALLQDAPVLILDEPTAHLDRLSGREVLETILAQAGRRSILLITHNLAGLERMDEILVLRAGRLVERGTHAGLVEQGGIYARMWALQSGLIRDDHAGTTVD